MGLGVVNQTKASASTTVAAGSPSLSVNKIYTTTTKVTGKATKGVKVIVESSKKKALASATASKTTGAYSVKLPAKQKLVRSFTFTPRTPRLVVTSTVSLRFKRRLRPLQLRRRQRQKQLRAVHQAKSQPAQALKLAHQLGLGTQPAQRVTK